MINYEYLWNELKNHAIHYIKDEEHDLIDVSDLISLMEEMELEQKN